MYILYIIFYKKSNNFFSLFKLPLILWLWFAAWSWLHIARWHFQYLLLTDHISLARIFGLIHGYTQWLIIWFLISVPLFNLIGRNKKATSPLQITLLSKYPVNSGFIVVEMGSVGIEPTLADFQSAASTKLAYFHNWYRLRDLNPHSEELEP